MKKNLVVDFNGTIPVYTHYFTSAINDTGVETEILGIKRETDLHVFKTRHRYIGFTRQKFTVLSYLVNWFYLIVKARSYNNVYIQWLPLLKYLDFDIIMARILIRINPNVFYTVHNLFPHNAKSKKIKQRYVRLYRTLPNLLVHSETTTRNLLRLKASAKIIRIFHGPLYSDLDIGNDVIPEQNRMGMIGTIKPYKGIEDSIQAIKILSDNNLNVSLLIAGKGDKDYNDSLLQLVHKLNIADRVEIINRYLSLEEVICFTKKVRAVLLPYKQIDQSGAALSSLALGTPVIAYRVGGLSEIIFNKENGILVEKNNILKLAEAINWISSEPIDFKTNCKKHLSASSWEKTTHILKI